jgi:predicted ATPase
VASRSEALRASGLTDLVGREEELELLLRSGRGQGQVVLLAGEPGIGKSRLTAALLERLAAEPHTRLRYFCSPQHTDTALFPIIGQCNAPPAWRSTTRRGRGSTRRVAGTDLDFYRGRQLDRRDAVAAE